MIPVMREDIAARSDAAPISSNCSLAWKSPMSVMQLEWAGSCISDLEQSSSACCNHLGVRACVRACVLHLGHTATGWQCTGSRVSGIQIARGGSTCRVNMKSFSLKLLAVWRPMVRKGVFCSGKQVTQA